MENFDLETLMAELAFDTPVVYHNYTDYWGSNQTLADELWDSIDTSPLVVALGDDWAKKHNLPLSIFRFPWDPSAKGVYYLKAFHGLHCLKSMRKAYIEYERGLTPTIHAGHFHHCIDALRQDVLCYADDTPMPMHDFPNKVGNNQIRTCRNFDRLIEWTREPERHACYHRWSDYKGMPKNKLEMFAFCDKDSEYHPLMKAYFEKFGHKPLYGADDHFRSS
ncbi:hypothetical protein G7Y89_g2405 [Cudoniella acicularis]|uniref:Uncharacterized protein n=1 Tax=Cudoniella acicularis TaxID=354080 RepID=A0A8H4RU69_9HELO|nr:hypothetical protein G7Y89_g2405 [Cudoniella acicularis]